MAFTKATFDYLDSGGLIKWITTAKTTAFTAVSGEGYLVDTSSAAVTVTLPASPSAGDEIIIVDYASNAGTNNITLGRNSLNIRGATDDLVLDNDNQTARLLYSGATKGWLVTTEAGAGAAAASSSAGLNDSDFFGDGNDILLMNFNSNLNDNSGTTTPTGSNETYTTGKFSNAVVGNGSTTRIDLGLNVSTFSGITISAWVYWQTSDAPKVFGGKTAGVTNRQTFEVHCSGNKVRYLDNSQDLYDAATGTLTTGWHHFAVTDDYSGNHQIYVDGVAITSTFVVASNYTANNDATMFYGMRNTGSTTGSETAGIIDQLRVFSTNYNSTQVASLSNES